MLFIPLFIFLYILGVFLFGGQRALQAFPFLLIFAALIYFLGWFAVNFFWLILLFWFINKMLAPKKSNTRYYKTYYTNKEAEEFFKNFTYGSFNQNSGYNYRNGSQNFNNFNSFTPIKDEYYSILGVSKNCTKEELKKAYFKKVKENHPDRYNGADEAVKKFHEEKLKKINEAYDALEKNM